MRLTLFVCFFLSSSLCAFADTTPPTPQSRHPKPPRLRKAKGPKQVKLGLYVTNLYDIDFVHNQFKLQFWTWFHHDDKSFKPNVSTEVVNARGFTRRNINEEVVKGIRWDTALIKAKVRQHWDVRHFPFDTQTLQVHIEDVNLPIEKLVFVPDKEGTKINPEALPPGWVLTKFGLRTSVKHYHTAFGDPSARSNTSQRFSRLTLTLHIRREGWRLFLTFFMGFFVAFALINIAFVINSSPRLLQLVSKGTTLSLCTGALFGAVGGIYTLAAAMPYTTSFTFADAIQIATFSGIALAITGAVSADFLAKLEKVALAARINQILSGSYLVLLVVFFFLFMT